MLGYFEQPAPFTPWTPEAADETASETEGLQEGQGGVSIEAPETTTESALTESALNQAMASLEGTGRKSGSGDSNSTVKASTSQWPAIRYLPNNARHATLEEVFRRTLRVDENGVMYHEGAEAPQSPDDLIAWEEIEEDPVDPNNPPPSGNFGLQLMPPTETMRRRMPGWNPRMHFNEEKQKFVCHACDFATIHEREFEYHIALEQRWITSTQ